jgi:signal peptidase II
MNLKKLLLFVTLPLYILDQWTKWWVVGRFPEPPPGEFSAHEHIPVIEGYFNLVRVHNQGVAFGLGNGTEWAPVLFMIVPFIALFVLRLFWKMGVFSNTISRVAVSLLITGIFGNFTDRLLQGSHLSYMKDAPFWERLRAGYVVDFLDVFIPGVNYRWPSFNVADSCVCVAAALLFIGGILEEKSKKKASAA